MSLLRFFVLLVVFVFLLAPVVSCCAGLRCFVSRRRRLWVFLWLPRSRGVGARRVWLVCGWRWPVRALSALGCLLVAWCFRLGCVRLGFRLAAWRWPAP